MKQSLLFIALLLLLNGALFAQVGINADNSEPDPSAIIDAKSTTKGVLMPRMTQTQIMLISNPANGLVVFCTSDNKFYAFISSANSWKEILYGSGAIAPFSCGVSFTIDHVAGNVAPVTKTTSYGTVTNLTGEPSKCWITSNLGANHPAVSVNDTSEASAGWYWQFNRKQGYMNDGITTTPAWTIMSIIENSDWTTENDPCNIELGDAWRIPTKSEWWNVSAFGAWTNWYGSWLSGLNLHAAGHLMTYGGTLLFRGDEGNYWSSTQMSDDGGEGNGWELLFISGWCGLNNTSKARGMSIRCLSGN
jgi:hypothetical protein